MIYAVLLVLIAAHAVVVIGLMEIKAKSDEKWRDALCIKEKIPLVPPPVRARETKMAENAKKWRNGGDGE